MANENKKSENVIKKYTVSIDISVEKVVDLDKEGAKLAFESDRGRFLDLPEDVVRRLSVANRTSYFEAFHANALQDDLRPTEGITVGTKYADPGRRLDVVYPPGFEEKYHPCWKRPDELQACLGMGYSLVTAADKVTSFAFDPKRNRHVVGGFGYEELILLKIPVADYNAMMKRGEDQSRRNNGAVEKTAMAEMKEAGVKPLNLASKA